MTTMGPNEKDGEEPVYGYVDMFKQPGDERPSHTYLLNTTKVKVGREHRCDIRLHSLRVSRLQCCLNISTNESERPKVFLQNLSSKATTKYKGEGITQNEQVELFSGDRFQLHDTELRFRAYEPSCPNAQPDPESSHRIPVIRLRAHEKAGTPERLSDEGSPKSPKTDKPKSARVSARSSSRMSKSMSSSAGSGELAGKRRKSSEIDMRKAVLKKTFRSSIKIQQIAESMESSSSSNNNGYEVSVEDGQSMTSEGLNENQNGDVDGVEVATTSDNIHSHETVIEEVETDLIQLSPAVAKDAAEKDNPEGEELFEDIEREMFVLHHGGEGNEEEPMEIDISSDSSDGIANADTQILVTEEEVLSETCEGDIVEPDPDPELLLLVQNALANTEVPDVAVDDLCPASVIETSQIGFEQNNHNHIVLPTDLLTENPEPSASMIVETPSKTDSRNGSLFDGSVTMAKTFCTAFDDEDRSGMSMNVTTKTMNDVFFDAEEDDISNSDDVFEDSSTTGNMSKTEDADESEVEVLPLDTQNQGEEPDVDTEITQQVEMSPRIVPMLFTTTSPGKKTLELGDKALLNETEENNEDFSPEADVVSVHEIIDLDDSSSDNITGDKSDERLLTGTDPFNFPAIDSEEIIELDQEANQQSIASDEESEPFLQPTTVDMDTSGVDTTRIDDFEKPITLPSEVPNIENTQVKPGDDSANNGERENVASATGPEECETVSPITASELEIESLVAEDKRGTQETENDKTESVTLADTQVLTVEESVVDDFQLQEKVPDIAVETPPARALRPRRATTDSVNGETLSTPRRGTRNHVEIPRSLNKRIVMTTPRRGAQLARITQVKEGESGRTRSLSEEPTTRETPLEVTVLDPLLRSTDLEAIETVEDKASEAKIMKAETKESLESKEDEIIEVSSEYSEPEEATSKVVTSEEILVANDNDIFEVDVTADTTSDTARVVDKKEPDQDSTKLSQSAEGSGSNSSYFVDTCTSDIEDDLESLPEEAMSKELPARTDSPDKVGQKTIQKLAEVDMELQEDKENQINSNSKDETSTDKDVTRKSQRKILTESELCEHPKPVLRECSVVLQRIIVHVETSFSSDEEDDIKSMAGSGKGLDLGTTDSSTILVKSKMVDYMDADERSISESVQVPVILPSRSLEQEQGMLSKDSIVLSNYSTLPASTISCPVSPANLSKTLPEESLSPAKPAERIPEELMEEVEEENTEEAAVTEAEAEPATIHDLSRDRSPQKALSEENLSPSSVKKTTPVLSTRVSAGGQSVSRREESEKESKLNSSKTSLAIGTEESAYVEEMEDLAEPVLEEKKQVVVKESPSAPGSPQIANSVSATPVSKAGLPKKESVKSKLFASTPKQSEKSPVVTPGTIRNCSIILQRVNVSTDISTPVTTRSGRHGNLSSTIVTPAVKATPSTDSEAKTKRRNKSPTPEQEEGHESSSNEEKSAALRSVIKKTPKSVKGRSETKTVDVSINGDVTVSTNRTEVRSSVGKKTPEIKESTPRRGRSRIIKPVEVVDLDADNVGADNSDEKARSSSDTDDQPETKGHEKKTKKGRGRTKGDEDVFVKPKSPLKKSRRGRKTSDDQESDSSSSSVSSTRSTRRRMNVQSDVVVIDDEEQSAKEESRSESESRNSRINKRNTRRVLSSDDDEEKIGKEKETSTSVESSTKEDKEAHEGTNKENSKQAHATSRRVRQRAAVTSDEDENSTKSIPAQTETKGRRGQRTLSSTTVDDVPVTDKESESIQISTESEYSAITGKTTQNIRKGQKKGGRGENNQKKNKKQDINDPPGEITAAVDAPSSSKASRGKLGVKLPQQNPEPFVKIVPIDAEEAASTRSHRQNNPSVDSEVQVNAGNSRNRKGQKTAVQSPMKTEFTVAAIDTKGKGRVGRKIKGGGDVQVPGDHLIAKTTRSNRRRKSEESDDTVETYESKTKVRHFDKPDISVTRGKTRQKKAPEILTIPDESDDEEEEVENQNSSLDKKQTEGSVSRGKRVRERTVEKTVEDEEEESEPQAKRGRLNHKKGSSANLEVPKSKNVRKGNRKTPVVETVDPESDEKEVPKSKNLRKGNRKTPVVETVDPESDEEEVPKSKNLRKGNRKTPVVETVDPESDEEEVPKSKNLRKGNRKTPVVETVDPESDEEEVPKSKNLRKRNRKAPLVEEIDPESDEEVKSSPAGTSNLQDKSDNEEFEKAKPSKTKRGGRIVKKAGRSDPGARENEVEEPIASKPSSGKNMKGGKEPNILEEKGDSKKSKGRQRVGRSGNAEVQMEEETDRLSKNIDEEEDEDSEEKVKSSSRKKTGKSAGSQNKKDVSIPSTSRTRIGRRKEENKVALKGDDSSDESNKKPTNRSLKRNQGGKVIVEENEESESASEAPSLSPSKGSAKTRGRPRREAPNSKVKSTKSNKQGSGSARVVLQLPNTPANLKEPEIVDILSDDEDDAEPEKPAKRLRHTTKDAKKPAPATKASKPKATRKKQK